MRSYQLALSALARVIPLGILINFFVGLCTRYTIGNSYQFLCRSLHALYHWEFLSISLSVSWHALYPAMRSYQLALSALARVIPLGILINFFVGLCTRYTIGNSYQFLCRSLHALYHWEFLSISLSALARVIPLGILINFFVGFLACVIPCYEVLSVCFVGFSTRYTLGNSYQFLCRSLHALYHWEFLSISLSVSWHALYPAMRSYQLALSALARFILCCEVLSISLGA